MYGSTYPFSAAIVLGPLFLLVAVVGCSLPFPFLAGVLVLKTFGRDVSFSATQLALLEHIKNNERGDDTNVQCIRLRHACFSALGFPAPALLFVSLPCAW